MPVTEGPPSDSSGRFPCGIYSGDSRFGSLQDFMFLVDSLHRKGIAVILDWAPFRFGSNAHGLALFDGGKLYEREDLPDGELEGWMDFTFNYGRPEVIQFLISNAHFWLDLFHIDGLRLYDLDSVLYITERKDGKGSPANRYGGHEDLDGLGFIRALNSSVSERFPDVQMIAGDADSWPMVSRPIYIGGLGFGLKWNRAWIGSTLSYFSKEPVHRKYHHDQLGLNPSVSAAERSILALSHETASAASPLSRMPGDEWQRFANIRLLLGYLYGYPGKKLLFMGCEFGRCGMWNPSMGLDWSLLETRYGRGVSTWVRDLNKLYRREPALYVKDFSEDGFAWLDHRNWEESVLGFLRRSGKEAETLIVVCNFTPVPRRSYRVGVPLRGFWVEECNSDAIEYCGSGMGNFGRVETEPVPYQGYADSISMTLPPLGILFLRWGGDL